MLSFLLALSTMLNIYFLSDWEKKSIKYLKYTVNIVKGVFVFTGNIL